MYKMTAMIFLLTIFVFSAAQAVPQRKKLGEKSEVKNQALWAELTGKDVRKLDDVGLYSEILANYQVRDFKGLRIHLETLLKRFPTSPYADNALYLGGQLALEIKNYPEALKHFQRIVQYYPQSNKMVSATFAKGLAYKKMNLDIQAKKVFFDLRKKYPGSPESYRAESELKLIR